MVEVRRQRRTAPRAGTTAPGRLGQLPYALVLIGVAAGLGLIFLEYVKPGSVLIAAAVLFGALARLVLPVSQVGMLAVRKKSTDVLTLTFFAVAIAGVTYVLAVRGH